MSSGGGSTARKIRFVVDREDEGLRLDQVLARRIPDLSRRRARLLIELGGVFVERVRVKVMSRRARAGQVVEAHFGGALERARPSLGQRARDLDAAALPGFRVVHGDSSVVVVDKPSGLLTAPTPESDRNNLADLLQRRSGGGERIWVVHRLDLETSGLLVFARTGAASRVLADLFREHDVEREYLTVVEGRADAAVGLLDAPIEGQPARTQVEPIALGEDRSLLRVRLETGRTHQVRIHLSSVGHPVCADRRYGRPGALGAPRLALHATRLGFQHPDTGRPCRFDSPWPPDLAAWLAMEQRDP